MFTRSVHACFVFLKDGSLFFSIYSQFTNTYNNHKKVFYDQSVYAVQEYLEKGNYKYERMKTSFY